MNKEDSLKRIVKSIEQMIIIAVSQFIWDKEADKELLKILSLKCLVKLYGELHKYIQEFDNIEIEYDKQYAERTNDVFDKRKDELSLGFETYELKYIFGQINKDEYEKRSKCGN